MGISADRVVEVCSLNEMKIRFMKYETYNEKKETEPHQRNNQLNNIYCLLFYDLIKQKVTQKTSPLSL